MEVGDIIQIEGYFGFLKDPKMEVLEIEGSLARLRDYPQRPTGGVLEWQNTSKHSIGSFTYKKVIEKI